MEDQKNGLAVVLPEDHYEDLELQYPGLRLEEAGFDVQVASPEKGAMYTSKHGYPVEADVSFNEVDVRKAKVLVIRGAMRPTG